MDAVRVEFCRLLADRRGATAVEYGVLAALIVIAIIGALAALGGGTNGMWTDVGTTVTQAI